MNHKIFALSMFLIGVSCLNINASNSDSDTENTALSASIQEIHRLRTEARHTIQSLETDIARLTDEKRSLLSTHSMLTAQLEELKRKLNLSEDDISEEFIIEFNSSKSVPIAVNFNFARFAMGRYESEIVEGKFSSQSSMVLAIKLSGKLTTETVLVTMKF